MMLGYGIAGDAQADGSRSIENRIASQHGDTLQGDSVNAVLSGHSGDDVLIGNGAIDTLDGIRPRHDAHKQPGQSYSPPARFPAVLLCWSGR